MFRVINFRFPILVNPKVIRLYQTRRDLIKKFKTFSDVEIRSNFKNLQNNGSIHETKMLKLISPNKDIDKVDFESYKKAVIQIGGEIDKRIYIAAISFALTGLSIGIIIPTMPMLVQVLSLTTSDYGVLVGLSVVY